MILYKDNPNLSLRVVDTFTGEKEYRKNCRHIKGTYYIKNKDVFEINSIWYKKDSPKIVYDYEVEKYVLVRNGKIIGGVVGVDREQLVFGNFSSNLYNNVQLHDVHGGHRVINSTLLLENGYFEDKGSNLWIKRNQVSESSFRELTKIRNEKSYSRKGYNIEDNVDEFLQKKASYESYKTNLSKDVRQYARLIGDCTFGIESEVAQGSIADNLQYRMGLVACRDGSLTESGNGYRSAEWVSVPMSGAKGLQNIVNIGNELKRSCNIDLNCSYHIHIGNIRTDRAFIVALYMLSYNIQNEVLRMFPYYKTDYRDIKKKNYCQKLKKLGIHPLVDFSKDSYSEFINSTYSKIFTFLSEGRLPTQECNRKQKKHPIAQKWSRETSRYFWINLQGMLFSERLTVEHRLHESTTSSQKMVNWFFMSVAIIRYTETHIKDILLGKKVSFVDVLNYYKNVFFKNERAIFLSEYLISYYNSRCLYFEKDLKNGDKVSQKWLDDDKNYEFSYGNVSYLF